MEITRTTANPATTPAVPSKKQSQPTTAFSAQLAAQTQAAQAAETQPAQASGGSRELTGEEFAYLANKYAGRVLSTEERAEFLDTLHQMGITDRAQCARMLTSYPYLQTASAGATSVRVGPLLESSGGEGGLTVSLLFPNLSDTLSKIKSDQELLAWLDALDWDDPQNRVEYHYDISGNLFRVVS